MGSTLDYYYNKSKIWLPMKAENHDPSNTTGVELIVDGDMEAATTAAWTPGGATLSKETGGAHSGDRWLKVTTGAVQYAYQILFTVGKKYRVTGWAKGDGSSFPQVYSGSSWWIGSSSTSWQYFDVTFVAGETRLRFYATGAGFTGFDDITVEELESRTLDVSGYGNHAILGDGSTPVTMPTKLQKRGYNFVAGGLDRLTLVGNFQGTDTWTIIIRNTDLSAAGAYLWDGRAIPGVGSYAVLDTVGGILVSSGTVYRNGKQDANYITESPVHIISVTGQVTASGTGNLYIGERFNLNSTTSFLGDLLHFSMITGTLTAPQVIDFHQKLLREVNHV